jgi:hypothetical protein
MRYTYRVQYHAYVSQDNLNVLISFVIIRDCLIAFTVTGLACHFNLILEQTKIG